jgi:hypothetical protein
VKVLIPVLVAFLAGLPMPQGTAAPSALYEDMPLGSLPAESVNVALRKTLSPQGRYVILAVNGTVRIFGTPDKIAEARKVLEALRNAPSIVTFQIDIRTGMHEVTRQNPGSEPIASGYEIPVPQTYSPPRIVGQNVAPGMPGNFTTRQVDRGSGSYVNPRAYVTGGYVTGTEVRTQQTGLQGGVIHRFKGSTEFPKAVAIPVSSKVDDPAGLHDWAVTNGAIAANEPAWAGAGTDIVVTPEDTSDGVLLNMTPEIVIPGGNLQAPRKVPLKTCSTSVLVKRGVPAVVDGFTGADSEFYRLFMGAQESNQNASTRISVSAGIDYIAQPAGR